MSMAKKAKAEKPPINVKVRAISVTRDLDGVVNVDVEIPSPDAGFSTLHSGDRKCPVCTVNG